MRTLRGFRYKGRHRQKHKPSSLIVEGDLFDPVFRAALNHAALEHHLNPPFEGKRVRKEK